MGEGALREGRLGGGSRWGDLGCWGGGSGGGAQAPLTSPCLPSNHTITMNIDGDGTLMTPQRLQRMSVNAASTQCPRPHNTVAAPRAPGCSDPCWWPGPHNSQEDDPYPLSRWDACHQLRRLSSGPQKKNLPAQFMQRHRVQCAARTCEEVGGETWGSL